MVAEGKIAVEMGFWNIDGLSILTELLQKAGLPTVIPNNMAADQIIDAMKLDKKSRGGNIEMVLPKAIGEMATVDDAYGIKIDESVIKKVT